MEVLGDVAGKHKMPKIHTTKTSWEVFARTETIFILPCKGYKLRIGTSSLLRQWVLVIRRRERIGCSREIECLRGNHMKRLTRETVGDCGIISLELHVSTSKQKNY